MNILTFYKIREVLFKVFNIFNKDNNVWWYLFDEKRIEKEIKIDEYFYIF